MFAPDRESIRAATCRSTVMERFHETVNQPDWDAIITKYPNRHQEQFGLMISSTQMRPGMVVKFNNDLFSVFSVAHRTPGNLRGFVQANMRNLRSGTMIVHRFSTEDIVY